MFFSKYNKTIRKIFTFAIAMSVSLFFAFGAGGGDDDDYDDGDYFSDADYASMIQKVRTNTPLSLGGNTYYISPSGNDKNRGTLEAPFKTFCNALKKLEAGDTLIVMDGTYSASIEDEVDDDDDNAIEIKKSGTASNFITIKAQNNRKAILSGENNTKNDDYALVNIRASYILLDGLVFRDLKSDDGAKGVQFANGVHHVAVANCEFTAIKTTTRATKSNEVSANAIIAYGDNASKPIKHILVYNNYCHNMETGWGECISITENCEYVSIINNKVDTTENIGIDVGGNYRTELPAAKRFTRYAYIEGNMVKNESTAKTYKDTCYGIYADGGQHVKIINNTVENCMGGIEAGAEKVNDAYPTKDITITGNTLVDCTDIYFSCGGFEKVRGWVKDVKFTGNTCTANKEADGMVNLSKCDNVKIEGNTFRKNGSFDMNKIYEQFSSEYTKNIIVGDNTWIGF